MVSRAAALPAGPRIRVCTEGMRAPATSLIDSAGLWGREGGGRGAFVCGVCVSEAGVGSTSRAAAVPGGGEGPCGGLG